MSAMKNLLSTYIDEQGVEHEAIFLQWSQVRDILGRDHDGSAEDDRRLISALKAIGAPPWIDGAAGWIDSDGWGLIGPRLSVEGKERGGA